MPQITNKTTYMVCDHHEQKFTEGMYQASTTVGLKQSANTPLVDQASTTVELAQSANTPLVDQASTSVG